MTDIKYLEVVSVTDELPKPGSATVAFVPGEGFQGAVYNGPDVSPVWRSTITQRPIEPTHWMKPLGGMPKWKDPLPDKELVKQMEAFLDTPEVKGKIKKALDDVVAYGYAIVHPLAQQEQGEKLKLEMEKVHLLSDKGLKLKLMKTRWMHNPEQ